MSKPRSKTPYYVPSINTRGLRLSEAVASVVDKRTQLQDRARDYAAERLDAATEKALRLGADITEGAARVALAPSGGLGRGSWLAILVDQGKEGDARSMLVGEGPSVAAAVEALVGELSDPAVRRLRRRATSRKGLQPTTDAPPAPTVLEGADDALLRAALIMCAWVQAAERVRKRRKD